MIFTKLFWNILGLGLSVPCTAIVLINLWTKTAHGDTYQLDLPKLFKVYVVAVVGWALVFGVSL